LILRK